METHFRAGDNSGEIRPARVERRHLSSITAQSMRLRDRFELDRPHSSHGDNHRKARNNDASSSATSSGKYLKQQTKTRRVNAADNDELVKHMSNLPSYLERAVKPQEKAFSVGVLDWGLLEKWQSSKQVPCRSVGSSSSNSITTSVFSTEESSTCSQAHHSPEASHHRHHQFPSVASVSDRRSRNVRNNPIGSTVESNMRKGLNSSSTASSSKPASKEQCHSGLEKQARRSRRSQSMSLNCKPTEKDENPTLVRPLDDCSTVSIMKGPKTTATPRNLTEKELNSTERYSKARNAELNCSIPHSCPLPCDSDEQKIRVLRPCRSHEAESDDKESAAVTQLGSTGRLSWSLKEGSSIDNHRAMKTELPAVAVLPQGSRISKPPVETANARDPSPTGRFSFHLGSRKSSSTEDALLLQNCGARAVDKPYTIREAHTSSIEKPSIDKSAAMVKSRSSPLKRLLEPLLKSRDATNYRLSTSLKKASKPVNSATKMPDRPSTAPGIRVGLNVNVDKSTNSHQNGQHNEPAVVQALLQVVVQNGCPLFTFAVDSVKDILCAALGKLASDKTSGDGYLYTFFSIQEIKNKSWINLRGKGSGHEYNPNVVAQMEVSESQLTKSNGNKFLRQFVLSAVDLKPGEKSESEYQINDELAALVICLPGMADDKMQLNKYYGTTVILPSGIHTLPSKGKPSSLIERWRSGGQCDCGGWDPGCELRILSDSKCQPTSSGKFKLYDKGGIEGKHQPIFTMAPFKDKEGVLSISFSSSISPLQAFSICLAVLDSRKLLRPPTPAKVQEAKSSDQTSRDKVSDSHFSVPPLSPAGRV